MQSSPQLSNREKETVHLLLEGNSNKLIARGMKISERTVEFHLKNIYEKFQVSSRLELVLKLKNDDNWLKSEDLGASLGESTVVDDGVLAENGDRLSISYWVTSSREAVSKISKELRMTDPLDSGTDNDTGQMTFYKSIRKCLTKYADFNGRASRSEFWWFMLFVVLGASAFTLLSETLGSLYLLAVLLPLLAAGARRLRDSGKSAWWLLILPAPVGGIIALGILWASPSTDSFVEQDTLPA
ncbi:MAG: DUF805 domain-containing protein [Caldilineaceae bacterium]|nr:DUF805 domain-containing protein [Caldilineaceae bacterium]